MPWEKYLELFSESTELLKSRLVWIFPWIVQDEMYIFV